MNFKPAMFVLAAALSGAVCAQTPATPPTQKQAPAEKTPIYGHQMMTDAERAEYHAKMRALKTPEERQAFRAEHHKLMQQRAKERGITLPDMPAAGGMGQHHGQGQKMHDGMHDHMGEHGERGMGPPPSDQSPGPTTTPPPTTPPPK